MSTSITNILILCYLKHGVDPSVRNDNEKEQSPGPEYYSDSPLSSDYRLKIHDSSGNSLDYDDTEEMEWGALGFGM